MTTPTKLSQQLGNLNLSAAAQTPPCADLSEQIQNLSLAEGSNAASEIRRTNQHLLTFDYPALDLLTDEAEAYMPEPHLIDWRPRPEAFPFHLDMWDPLDLFHYLASGDDTSYTSDVDTRTAMHFLNAIEQLASIQGHSTMSIVAFVKDGMPWIRIRVSTFSQFTGGTHSMFWSLMVTDWQDIMAQSRPWIEVMGDVFYRKTARSYFAAEAKMNQRSPAFHLHNSSTWANRWGTGTPLSAQNLLVRYLGHLQPSTVLTFHGLEEGGKIHHLPCGHDVFLRKEKIESLSEEACREARCYMCDTRILPAGLYEEAMMYEEYFLIYEASGKVDGWAKLHEWITDDTPRTFSKTALLHAVPSAINSLRLPQIIESNHVSPVSFKQTAIALTAIVDWLNEQPDDLHASPYDLAHQLEDEALNKVLEAGMAVPPTWNTFLKMFLNRAVNLAILRRCSKLGGDHLGVHLHGSNVFVSMANMTKYYESGGGEMDLELY